MNERYQNNNRGPRGGVKEYKSDPGKQWLISRGSARDRAVELCIAGKITLKQIPDYTDRLTVLQFGQLSIDPMVDAEVIRIAKRIQLRMKEAKDPDEPDKPTFGLGFTDQCSTCVDCGGVCSVADENRPVLDCEHYYGKEDAEADAELKRQDEEKEQRHTEEESRETTRTIETKEGGVVYKCGTCQKEYKTLKGLEKHEKKCGGD